MSLRLEITTNGQLAIAAAIASGTRIVFAAVALTDTAASALAPDALKLPGIEKWRAEPLSVSVTDTGNVQICAVVPPDIGGWYARSIGVYDINDRLIAYATFPESYKPVAEPDDSAAQWNLDLVLTVGSENKPAIFAPGLSEQLAKQIREAVAGASALTPATTAKLGGVIVGTGLRVDDAGKISTDVEPLFAVAGVYPENNYAVGGTVKLDFGTELIRPDSAITSTDFFSVRIGTTGLNITLDQFFAGNQTIGTWNTAAKAPKKGAKVTLTVGGAIDFVFVEAVTKARTPKYRLTATTPTCVAPFDCFQVIIYSVTAPAATVTIENIDFTEITVGSIVSVAGKGLLQVSAISGTTLTGTVFIKDFTTPAAVGDAVYLQSVAGVSLADFLAFQKRVFGSTATGEDALALFGATVTGDYAVGIGRGTVIAGYNAFAFGDYAECRGENSCALGSNTVVQADRGMAIGQYSGCYHADSVAIGQYSGTRRAKEFSVGRPWNGAGDPGFDRVLACVAPGTQPNDAVTIAQIQDQNTGNIYLQWFGTQAEYDAIAIKNPATIYNIFET